MTNFIKKIKDITNIKLTEDNVKNRELLVKAIDAYTQFQSELAKKIKNDERVSENDSRLNVSIGTDIGDLLVILNLTDDHAANGFYRPRDKTITLNLPVLIKDFDQYTSHDFDELMQSDALFINTDTLLELLHGGHVQSTFIHEFVHFFDDMVNHPLPKDKLTGHDYYNAAHERYAKLIQTILEITARIVKQHGLAMKELSPEDRLAFMKSAWRNDEYFMSYYNELDTRNKKKLLSRLYSYFSGDYWK